MAIRDIPPLYTDTPPSLFFEPTPPGTPPDPGLGAAFRVPSLSLVLGQSRHGLSDGPVTAATYVVFGVAHGPYGGVKKLAERKTGRV